jgi:hypothetical protein
MADIFISYATPDRQIAANLAQRLSRQHYSVWWDSELYGGADFRQTIMKELSSARAVIVIWSANSVHSRWVCDESDEALRANKLIPIAVGTLPFESIPFGFRSLHTLKIDDFDGVIRTLKVRGVAAPSSIVRDVTLSDTKPDIVEQFLRFSKAFYSAFEIKKDRLREWLFLCLLLQKEKDGRVDVRDLTHEDIEGIARRPLRSTYFWTNRLVEGLRSGTTPYLAPVQSERLPRWKPQRHPSQYIYEFNKAFDTALTEYLAYFLAQILGLTQAGQKVPSLFPEQRRALARALFSFQLMEYWKLWDSFFEKLAPVAQGYGVRSDWLKKELEGKATYWGLMLIVWRRHLGQPNEPADIRDIMRDVFEFIPDTDPDDAKSVLKFLSGKPQIFTVTRSQGRRVYAFNRAYEEAFRSYTDGMRSTREEFARRMGDELTSLSPAAAVS